MVNSWTEASAHIKTRPLDRPDNQSYNIKKCLQEAVRDTMARHCSGISNTDDPAALQELQSRHPASEIPPSLDHTPPAITVAVELVHSTLVGFSKGSSPGWSKLHAQHLLDATNLSAPITSECLVAFTKWINLLLSGLGHPLLAPWLCGAPLTALNKKSGGFCPIAIGETF